MSCKIAPENVKCHLSCASGASAHAVRDVVFSRLVIGGKRALTLKDINATVNEWVGGISFQ